MTNDDGRKPEGAPERSPKAGAGRAGDRRPQERNSKITAQKAAGARNPGQLPYYHPRGAAYWRPFVSRSSGLPRPIALRRHWRGRSSMRSADNGFPSVRWFSASDHFVFSSARLTHLTFLGWQAMPMLEQL
jgi:hypothetical protein